MRESISKAIRDRRIRAAKSSLSYSKLTEKNISRQLEGVKQIVTGEYEGDNLDPSIRNLRNHYYRMKHDYTLSSDFSQNPTMTKRSVALWKRVSKAWEASGVSQEHFIKAQFDWFHKSFGKAPEVTNLVTDAAIERAKEFSGSKYRVIGNNIKAEITTTDVLRNTDQMVRDMCRAQNLTREEFYRKFILTGEFSLPKEFLKVDPIYKKVIEGEK